MASGAVWGIDVGQCALKALRCRAHDDPKKLVAEAFDYIEYPKILSQPGSDPTELVDDALKQFLSRNSVVGDRVAVSVSGQAGLARFIKLPPVETKKIPDIVGYEARQQIPFDLNDVVWDYQRMGGGSVEEGFALETEVGLFAMKRDAVFRTLEPFLKLDIEVDLVQLTPLVLYNLILFDQLSELPPADEYDPENPPESTVIISLGTDATDLVITNGYRVWQRSVPLGGNHFTKALTRELKLTFAKAEHLKRNATAAADPKAVFQAMRPIFSDLLTELQRSISYFSNLDRAAKIGRVVAVGNAMKLPGLRRYLSQSLGYEIEKLDSFRGLTGSQVVSAPAFQENLLSFGVSYGLALQGLEKGGVHTNLLPKEIIQDRLIRRKKPWAVAAAAVLLLACGMSYAAYSLATGTVDVDRWKPAETKAQLLISAAARFQSEAEQATTEFQTTDEIGQHLVGNVEGRIRWLELLKAINVCLPSGEDPPPKGADGKELEESTADRIARRKELHITNLECQQMDEVSQWYQMVKKWDPTAPTDSGTVAAMGDAAAMGSPVGGTGMGMGGGMGGGTGMGGGMGVGGGMGSSDAGFSGGSNAQVYGAKGPGWIISLSGHHYYNEDRANQGAQYVRNELIESLRDKKVKLPAVNRGETEFVTLEELGITFPVLVDPHKVYEVEIVDPTAVPETGAAGGMGGMAGMGMGVGVGKRSPVAGAGGTPAHSDTVKLKRFDFTVQFCWQPKTLTERHELEKTQEQADNPMLP